MENTFTPILFGSFRQGAYVFLCSCYEFLHVKWYVMNKVSARESVSIIIPAYNEADIIGNCLDSIAAQTVAPKEVIVVDNNCTDNTVVIALRYPFVKVVTEPKQGIIAARNKGFGVAKGTILARINADVVLEPNWVEAVIDGFTDSRVEAVTGSAWTHALFNTDEPKTKLYAYGYTFGAEVVFGVRILWGANMALRRSVWLSISDHACLNDKKVHEDQDISLLVAGRGGIVKMCPKMCVTTNEESYFYWPKFQEYWRRQFKTKRWHEKRGTYQSEHIRLISPLGIIWRMPFALGYCGFVGLSLAHYSAKRSMLAIKKIRKLIKATLQA